MLKACLKINLVLHSQQLIIDFMKLHVNENLMSNLKKKKGKKMKCIHLMF